MRSSRTSSTKSSTSYYKLNLKDYSSRKIFNGQIKAQRGVYLYSRLGIKDYLHQLAIPGKEGNQKSGSEEPLQSILSLSFSVGAMEKGLDDRNCLKSMTHHAAGIGSCAQSGMSIPSYLSLEMHLGKFPDQAEVHSWIVNFRVEVCAKAKNPMRALQWIKEIGAAKSLDDFITPKWMTVKDFPDCVKNWTRWWRQHWNAATILLIGSTKWPSAEPWHDKRAKNSYTERKTEECFQWKTIGSCSKRRIL